MNENEEKIIEELKKQTADVELPESLAPEAIEKCLETRKQKRWKPVYSYAAAAACCCIILGVAAVGITGQAPEKTGAAPNGAGVESANAESTGTTSEIVSANSYDEIYEYTQAIQEAAASGGEVAATYDNAAPSAKSLESAPQGGAAQGGEATYSDTNTREEGVGEGDVVKTDGKNLYILTGNKIKIVDTQKPEMAALATIKLAEGQQVSELYLSGNRLIVVYTETEQISYRQYTKAATYDISNPGEPKLLGEVSQSGYYDTMRVVGEYAYLFSNFSVNWGCARSDIQGYIPEIQGKTVKEGNIFMPQNPRGGQFVVISSFRLDSPDEKLDGKAVFGGSGTCYVSDESIYICEEYYDENVEYSQTSIRKLTYRDGSLEAKGQTKVKGTLNDSFSIDEYEGNLRLVTTVNPAQQYGVMPLARAEGTAQPEEEVKQSNSLYILDENLQEIGKLENLAKEEQVYSARFMGETGYFVTYRQVDPLFSVDLSDPKKPEIIGELKIPGFSEYLHPYGEGLLLGIGMDVDKTGTVTNGVKLSMFDISDPSAVTESQKYTLEGSYSTDVFYNYKAVLIDEEKNLIGFSANGDAQHYYIFSYDKKEGFTCEFDREMGGYTPGRGVYIGETLYLIVDNTVESYKLDTFEKIDDIVL